MNARRDLSVIVALIALVAMIQPASAGLISIASDPLSTSGAELLNTGTFVAAWNVNGNAASTPSVNGIAFPNAQPSDIAISGWPGTATDDANTTAHYSGAMAEIMGDALGTNGGSSGSITLNNLTMGDTYRIQLLHHQDINNNSQRQMQVHFGNSSGTAGAAFFAGDNQGYITTAVFTADATSQLFTVVGLSGSRGIINGISVFDVTAIPTPAALPAGLSLLAAGAMRRRRRRRA